VQVIYIVELIVIIVTSLGDTVEQNLKKALSESDFFSMPVDGSTDCSVVEKD